MDVCVSFPPVRTCELVLGQIPWLFLPPEKGSVELGLAAQWLSPKGWAWGTKVLLRVFNQQLLVVV